jgi:hypothetical protein
MIGFHNSQRQGAQSAKPAEIHLVSGDTVTTPDFERSDGWVIVFCEGMTGIDKMVSQESILFINRVNDDQQDSEYDDRLVADGGRNVPPCICGANLIETAVLTTEYAPVETARRPRMEEVPAAECSNCGQSVGAAFGMEAALAVWSARGESPPTDDSNENRERRLMADGGQRKPVNQHPILQKHVSVSPTHGVTEAVVNDYLEEIDEFTSEGYVRNIGDALPYDAVEENDRCVAAYTGNALWEEIFDRIGLTFDSEEYAETFIDSTRFALRHSHERHAVHQLGMDNNQPRLMLVARKDDENDAHN